MSNRLSQFRCVFTGLSIIFFLLLGACSASAQGSPRNIESIDNRNNLVEELIEKEDFIGLFKNANKIGEVKSPSNTNINVPVTLYLKKHCRSTADILKLLKDNFFEVKDVSNAGVYKDGGYQAVYGAERKATLLVPTFYSYLAYEVIIYIKDNNLEKVVAKVTAQSL